MAYDATLSTARDRVRFALGDTAADSILPGGETTYDAMLSIYSDNEVLVYQTAAGVLANVYSNQPNSVSSSGESVSWADRAAHWRLIASGSIPYPFGTDGSGEAVAVLSVVPATFRDTSANDEFSR